MIRCNVGVIKMQMIGQLPGFAGEVQFNPNGMDMKRNYRVRCDSKDGQGLKVQKSTWGCHRVQGVVVRTVLHGGDLTEGDRNGPGEPGSVPTVEDNKIHRSLIRACSGCQVFSKTLLEGRPKIGCWRSPTITWCLTAL